MAANASSLCQRFDRQFPVSRDLKACLNTVHSSYKLFEIHQVHTGDDANLEEGLYSVYQVILQCTKDILTVGKRVSSKSADAQCAAQTVCMDGLTPMTNYST